MSRGNRFTSRGGPGNSYNHRSTSSSYEGRSRYDDNKGSRSSNPTHEFRSTYRDTNRPRHRSSERHSPKRHRPNFYNAQGSRRDDYNGGTSSRYNAREATTQRFNRPTADVSSLRYGRPRENAMGPPPPGRRRPETSRDVLGLRGRGGIDLRRNLLRRQMIRKKLLNSNGPHGQRQSARSKNTQRSSVKRARRSRSRDKTPLDTKSTPEKHTATTIGSNSKDPADETWDLDIENEIEFDEIEADETVDPKQVSELKSDSVGTVGKLAESGEKRSVSAVKNTSNADKKGDFIKERKRPAKRSIDDANGKNFIKLICSHCDTKCITFREYASHLLGRNHRFAMRMIATKIRTKIQQMRVEQRQKQKTFELESKNTEALKPLYCLLCRLNYRQLKSEHQASDGHNQMKLLLTPFCKPCGNTFKSPMAFEAHRCSLDHIRKKARMEQHEKDDIHPEDLDLENFTTVDEVWTGDVDDEETNLEENENPVSIGRDHIKQVEVNYCGICRVYLSRREEQEVAINKHCLGRTHLKEFIRSKKNAKQHKDSIANVVVDVKIESIADDKTCVQTEEPDNVQPKEQTENEFKSNGFESSTNNSLMLNDEIDEEEMNGDIATDKFERYFEQKQNESTEEANVEVKDQD